MGKDTLDVSGDIFETIAANVDARGFLSDRSFSFIMKHFSREDKDEVKEKMETHEKYTFTRDDTGWFMSLKT